jgi:hypothetical protein
MTRRVCARLGGAVRWRISPWHDAQASWPDAVWRWCENATWSGRRLTLSHAIGFPDARSFHAVSVTARPGAVA